MATHPAATGRQLDPGSFSSVSLSGIASDAVGCALIIPMIIQTILLYPSGALWTDEPPNVSRLDPSEAIQADAEHPTRSRKGEG
jgi:hypothetical protein